MGADDRLPPGSCGGGVAAQQRNVGVVGRPGLGLRGERPRRLDPDRHLEPDDRGGQRRHGHQHGPQHVLSRCGHLAQWGRHGHRWSQRPTDQHLRPDDELVECGAANEHRPRLPGHDVAVERAGVHPRWLVVGRTGHRTRRKTGRGMVAHRRLAGADRCPGDTDVHPGCPGGLPGRQRRMVHRHLGRQSPPGRAIESDELDHDERHGQHHPGRDAGQQPRRHERRRRLLRHRQGHHHGRLAQLSGFKRHQQCLRDPDREPSEQQLPDPTGNPGRLDELRPRLCQQRGAAQRPSGDHGRADLRGAVQRRELDS